MAKKHNKICCVCGKSYQYCNSCGEYDYLPTWMNAFDTENCMKIFDISGRYNSGEYNKAYAKTLFDQLDIEGYENFKSEGVKKSLREIYESSDDEIEATNEEIEDIVSEPVVEDVEEEVVSSDLDPETAEKVEEENAILNSFVGVKKNNSKVNVNKNKKKN